MAIELAIATAGSGAIGKQGRDGDSRIPMQAHGSMQAPVWR